MSNTTYLQAVNGVLRRLRENTVQSVTETDYSTLIGDFVNDAKQYVEERYDWIGLEETIDIATSAGTSTYAVDGAGDSGNVKNFIDTETNAVLKMMPAERFRELQITTPLAAADPIYYAFTGTASDGDPEVSFRPAPNSIRTIKAVTDKSGVPLTADTDTIPVPSNCVVQLAYAMALDERGDTGGSTGRQQFALAEVFIGNAIMAESQKRPSELTWTVAGDTPNRTNWNSDNG